MLDKDVKVSISGTRVSPIEENSEALSTVTSGTYYKKSEKHYVIYDEVADGLITHNTLKLSEDRVELIKKGATISKLEFKKGEQTLSSYNLPFGSLMLGVCTNEMSIDIQEYSITARLEYELEINEEHTADCVIDICITNNK